MNSIGYSLKWDDALVNFVMKSIEDEKEFGARPIIRSIQDNVENLLTDKLLETDYASNYCFSVSCNESNEVVAI